MFESLDYPVSNRRIEAYYAGFPANSPASEPHQHGSAEFIYVLSGQLLLDVEGKQTSLATGGAVYFGSSAAHSYRRDGEGMCTVLVVTAS